MKKYKLTENIKKFSETEILYQIECISEFGDIKPGDLGGYIPSEEVLSQTGNCWIDSNSFVRGNSKISDNVIISGSFVIDSEISGDVEVESGSSISGSVIRDKSIISGSSVLNSEIGGDSEIFYNSVITDSYIIDTSVINSDINDTKLAGSIIECSVILNSEIYYINKIIGASYNGSQIKNKKEIFTLENPLEKESISYCKTGLYHWSISKRDNVLFFKNDTEFLRENEGNFYSLCIELASKYKKI